MNLWSTYYNYHKHVIYASVKTQYSLTNHFSDNEMVWPKFATGLWQTYTHVM